MPQRPAIPRPTAARVSLYLRELEVRLDRGQITVRSRELGDSLGFTDAQIRKDLRLLGLSGHPGVGYGIRDLLGRLRRLCGTDHECPVAIVGAGNIGRALLSYGRFETEGFRIAAVFDADEAKVGERLGRSTVRSMSELRDRVQRLGIRIGIVATPPESAQEAAERLVEAGVDGILNFAPRRLELPTGISVTEVDLSMSLVNLSLQIALSRMNRVEQAAPRTKRSPRTRPA